MNDREHLLVVAMEECAELTQALSKALRFGLDDHHPERPQDTNATEILTEYAQLQCLMEEILPLCAGADMESRMAEARTRKREALHKYLEYSRGRGRVSGGD